MNARQMMPMMVGLGVIVGVVIGLALNNIALWAGAGLAIGAGIGGILLIMQNKRK